MSVGFSSGVFFGGGGGVTLCCPNFIFVSSDIRREYYCFAVVVVVFLRCANVWEWFSWEIQCRFIPEESQL